MLGLGFCVVVLLPGLLVCVEELPVEGLDDVLLADGLGALFVDGLGALLVVGLALPVVAFCVLPEFVEVLDDGLLDCDDVEDEFSLPADGTYFVIVMEEIFLFSFTLEDILKFSLETRPSL